MHKPFDPAPGAQVAVFRFRDKEALVNQLEAKRFVYRMVGIDQVYVDHEADSLYASYHWPCTEDAIRAVIESASYPLLPKETGVLSLEQSDTREAIPA